EVTLDIFSGGANGALLTCSGGNTKTVSGGVATFSSCQINLAGTNYVLRASTTTPGVSPDHSTPFNISSGIETIIALSDQTQNGTAGQDLPDPLSVQVLDANHNPAAGVSVQFTTNKGSLDHTGQNVTKVTNSDGIASVTPTLAPGAGPNT